MGELWDKACDMWMFYLPVIKYIPKILFKAAHVIEVIIAIIGFIIAFIAPEYARSVFHWEAFDPRWGAIVFVMILFHFFLLSVYERYRDDSTLQCRKEKRLLLGSWHVSVGKETYEWTFRKNGSVSSTRHSAHGFWKITATEIRITWNDEHWDTFTRPLKPARVTGNSWTTRPVNAHKLRHGDAKR